MKKLNKQGFTLIELLAVIVILAIVLVVTIPTVLGSMDNAREDTFKASASSVAEWFEKQHAAELLGSADPLYEALSLEVGTPARLTAELASAAGINATDYDVANSCITLKSNGRVCVVLRVPGNGDKGTGKFGQLGQAFTATSSVCVDADINACTVTNS